MNSHPKISSWINGKVDNPRRMGGNNLLSFYTLSSTIATKREDQKLAREKYAEIAYLIANPDHILLKQDIIKNKCDTQGISVLKDALDNDIDGYSKSQFFHLDIAHNHLEKSSIKLDIDLTDYLKWLGMSYFHRKSITKKNFNAIIKDIIGQQVLALHALHSLGLAHRDFHRSNIFLLFLPDAIKNETEVYAPKTYLGDWDSVIPHNAKNPYYLTGAPECIAPEVSVLQAPDEKRYKDFVTNHGDFRSLDIYALGKLIGFIDKKFPNVLPNTLKDLKSKLIKIEPKNRLTLKEIKNHDYFKEQDSEDKKLAEGENQFFINLIKKYNIDRYIDGYIINSIPEEDDVFYLLPPSVKEIKITAANLFDKWSIYKKEEKNIDSKASKAQKIILRDILVFALADAIKLDLLCDVYDSSPGFSNQDFCSFKDNNQQFAKDIIDSFSIEQIKDFYSKTKDNLQHVLCKELKNTILNETKDLKISEELKEIKFIDDLKKIVDKINNPKLSNKISELQQKTEALVNETDQFIASSMNKKDCADLIKILFSVQESLITKNQSYLKKTLSLSIAAKEFKPTILSSMISFAKFIFLYIIGYDKGNEINWEKSFKLRRGNRNGIFHKANELQRLTRERDSQTNTIVPKIGL